MVYFSTKDNELRFQVNQFRFRFRSGEKKLVVVYDNGNAGLFFDQMEITPDGCFIGGKPYGNTREQEQDTVMVDLNTTLLEVSFTEDGSGVSVCLYEREDGTEKPIEGFVFRLYAGEWECISTDPYGIYETFLKITKTAEG